MPKKIRYCENHPEVVANLTCSQCKKRICYNCKIEAFGHIFCSMQCVAVLLAMEMVRFVFRAASGVMRGILSIFHWLGKRSRRGWVELILGLGILVCFYFIRKLTREINLLEVEGEGRLTADVVIDTTQIPPPKIVQPSEEGMVISNTLNITGEAGVNQIVSLSIDGELTRVVLPRGGKFVFEGVQLHRGDNRLEVRAMTEGGKVSSLQTLVLSYAAPTLAYLVKDFRRGSLDRKEVALTFDGGSIDNAAGEILSFLKEKGVISTFFLTGEFIRRYSKTVRQIVAEGHEVGNHTWSHPHLTTFAQNQKHTTLPDITAERVASEFSKTASLFSLVTGKKMVGLWRAPYGEYNDEILQWAAQAGYKHVGWTVGRGWEDTMDTLDWVADKNSESYRSADEIAQKILNYGEGKASGANGAIILMHLGTHRKDDFPHRKLPEIIDGLRKEGYRFVKVSEMITE